MKKAALALLLLFMTATFVYAGILDTVTDIANEVLSNSKESGEVKSGNANGTISGSPSRMKEAGVITAQFDDFKWGMSPTSVKGLLLTKGKMVVANKYSALFAGPNLVYEDKLFDEPCTIFLHFTPKSEKLSSLLIARENLFNQNLYDYIVNFLNKKYGESWKDNSDDTSLHWGNSERGDLILLFTSDTFMGGGIFLQYTNKVNLDLLEKEEKEMSNEVISRDSSKL